MYDTNIHLQEKRKEAGSQSGASMKNAELQRSINLVVKTISSIARRCIEKFRYNCNSNILKLHIIFKIYHIYNSDNFVKEHI